MLTNNMTVYDQRTWSQEHQLVYSAMREIQLL